MKTRINLNNNRIIVTGAAGFIGYHLVIRLLKECIGSMVIGVDNMSDYTPMDLKRWRLNEIEREKQSANVNNTSWEFRKLDISNKTAIDSLFDEFEPCIVINLAAQAGVRYSIENPYSYLDSNIILFHSRLKR